MENIVCGKCLAKQLQRGMLLINLLQVICVSSVLHAATAPDSDVQLAEEFRVKREERYEFATKPTVQRAGDRVTIEFESRGFCDVTVAIEDGSGKIIRHLASGVLGKNAPPPLQSNSLKQKLIWDGKNDRGEYVDNKDGCVVRVSLGLKPCFEKTLNWSALKRLSSSAQVAVAAPEGVYLYESGLFDRVQLFDHNGDYQRTIYPFAADKIAELKGIRRHRFPQDGAELPLKGGFYYTTLLHGTNLPLRVPFRTHAFNGSAMAVSGQNLAIAGKYLACLSADGGTSNSGLSGPLVAMHELTVGYNYLFRPQPWSAAFAPDGKTLYLSGLGWHYFHTPAFAWGTFNSVWRLDYGSQASPQLFVGTAEPKGTGEGDQAFDTVAGVAVDAKGRVYVCDHWNHVVKIFTPEGKLLKSLKVNRPALLSIHHRTQEIYVFSLPIAADGPDSRRTDVEPLMTRFEALERGAAELARVKLPLPKESGLWNDGMPGIALRAELDSWCEPPMIWLTRVRRDHQKWEDTHILLGRENEGKFEVVRDLGAEALKQVAIMKPAGFARERLYVNPANGNVYLAPDGEVDKNFDKLIQWTPGTWKQRVVELPCVAEDIAFDSNGLAYLRVDGGIARYDAVTWREVPWDYGEEREAVRFAGTYGGKATKGISILAIPGSRTSPFWHLGGIAVSPRGHLAVTTWNGDANKQAFKQAADAKQKFVGETSKPYRATIYPGRFMWGEVHVFDKHGQTLIEDAFPGIGHMNGLWLDGDDNLYCMVSAQRLINGKPYDTIEDDLSDTLIKAKAGKAKALSSGPVPVPLGENGQPDRLPDVQGSGSQGIDGLGWVEGAEWFYGGVGFAGMLASWASGGCCCWNARMAGDYFGRTFAPELRHFSVAVLDSAGNLILRVGHYGNVEDGQPLDPGGGPARTRSIGGDEVALFHAPYLATHTDNRLFIADPGNGRVLSVKLDYYVSDRVPLKDVPDTDGGK